VCRFDFTSAHLDLALPTDKALCDIDRVTIVLSEAKDDINFVVCRSFADSLHLRGVDLERVFDVLWIEDEVDDTGPGSLSFSW
jgi:hypothetical protein